MKSYKKQIKDLKQGFYILLCLCIFLIFFLLYFVLTYPDIFPESMKIDAKEISDCENLNIEDTSYCLRDYVSTFFKYTETDDWKNLNETELKEYGGDCRNWAFYYKQLAEGLGYEAETFTFMINQGFGHRFTVIYSEEGYCRLDMLHEPDCYFFKNVNDRIWLE